MSDPRGGHDVFISYSRADASAVTWLAERIGAAGRKVFLDAWDIAAGDRWQEALESALGSSRAALVVVGVGGLGPWHAREVRVALDRAASEPAFRVIPLLLPGADGDMLPPFLRAHSWVDARAGMDDSTVASIVAGLDGKSAAGRRGSSASASPRKPTSVTETMSVRGSGASAQGRGAQAAGERGVVIGGNVSGSTIVTGDDNVVHAPRGRRKPRKR